MHFVDLDELPGLLGGRLVARRPGLVRFRRRDYLGDPAVPLADAVRGLVAERTGSRPEGPVRLLTHLRYLGHRQFWSRIEPHRCLGLAGALACKLANDDGRLYS